MLTELKNKMLGRGENKAAPPTSDEIRERLRSLEMEQRDLQAKSADCGARADASRAALAAAEERFIAGGLDTAEMRSIRTSQLAAIAEAEGEQAEHLSHLGVIDKAFRSANRTLADSVKAEALAAAAQKLEEHREWRQRFSGALVDLMKLNAEGAALEDHLKNRHPQALRQIRGYRNGVSPFNCGSIWDLANVQGPFAMWLRNVGHFYAEDLAPEAHDFLEREQTEGREERERRRARAVAATKSSDAMRELEKYAVIHHDFQGQALDQERQKQAS